MSLKASNKVDTNKYELEIEVEGKIFDDAVNKVFLKKGKGITIPGFRKGKAPRAFIEKYYGEQVFYEDAINSLYPEALREAVEAAELDIVQDEFSSLEHAGKDGLCFKVTVTVKPEVELSAYKGLKAVKKPSSVADEEVEEELKKVQQRNSRLVSVEDRAAEKDDIAVIDFEGFVDGEAFNGGKAENYNLTLGSGQFIPGFEEQVIGHNAEDSFDVNVTFPEDYQEEALKGKPAVFKVHLHEIKRRELPVLDDEFAKDVSEFETLDAYKEHLKEEIAERKERASKDDVENQLVDQLIENLKAEIPEVMFEQRVDDNVQDFAYRLRSQGLDINSYMKYTGLDKDGLRNSFRPQAERQVKVRLALEKIAALENIQPTAEELDAEYEKMAKAYGMDVEKVRPLIPEKELGKDVAVEKAINLVRESAEITEAEEKAAEEKAAE